MFDIVQMLGGSFPISPFNKGATPMPKTHKLMVEGGTMATNFFIHTPICCPSRSEVLSGKYFHNIKAVGGPGTCMHVKEDTVNNATFAKYLTEGANYKVGMFGKYINNVPNYVPVGFDTWMANGGGDYIAPVFPNCQNVPGVADGGCRFNKTDYTTAVVGNKSIEWIRQKAADGSPWLAYVAPKACHEPFNPAPVRVPSLFLRSSLPIFLTRPTLTPAFVTAQWYVDHWDPSWPSTEPKTPNWNTSAVDHHGAPSSNAPLNQDASTGAWQTAFRAH